MSITPPHYTNLKSSRPLTAKVNLSIGHFIVRKRISLDNENDCVHEFNAYVKGEEDREIHHLVEEIIFRLPNSFDRSTRVMKTPPYQVTDVMQASFSLYADVFFKNMAAKQSKETFQYEINLPDSDETLTSEARRECVTIHNPSWELRCNLKVIREGGKFIFPKGTEAVERSRPRVVKAKLWVPPVGTVKGKFKALSHSDCVPPKRLRVGEPIL